MKMYALMTVIIIIVGATMIWTTSYGNFGYILNENHFENGEISFNYFKDWDTVNVNHETGEIVGYRHSTADAQRNFASSIYVDKIPSKYGSNLEDAYKQAVEQESQVNTYKAISNRTLTVDGAKAYELVFYENIEGDNTKNIYIIVEKNGRIYKLSYIGEPDFFDREKNDFYFLVNSFKIK